jgi:sulfite reductase alpha subunit-like flavoprotein
VSCLTLNSAKKLDLKEVASAVIIICATTGNGDAPENADAWWRGVKLRSAVIKSYMTIKTGACSAHK